MYGAIAGDIIGSVYEWHNIDHKDFKLFRRQSHFTDDSAMTIAVGEALMKAEAEGSLSEEGAVTEYVIESMRHWGKEYPNCGFGGRFRAWLSAGSTEPYNSWGNGSAMRVSAAGWMEDDLQKTRKLARWTAEVTHNHPEGIKGAEAVVSAIFLARTGAAKEEIKRYITDAFGDDLDRTCDEIRPGYGFDVSCQGSVPEAIISFLEGTDFEDTIRNAVSLGGDSDTIAAIAGSIAEAFYGVPDDIKSECEERLPDDLRSILREYAAIGYLSEGRQR